MLLAAVLIPGPDGGFTALNPGNRLDLPRRDRRGDGGASSWSDEAASGGVCPAVDWPAVGHILSSGDECLVFPE